MDEVNSEETDFLEINRTFNFMFEEGYHGQAYSIGGREPGITLQNGVKNRIVNIFWSESGFLDVTISRKKILALRKQDTFFSIRDFYKYFNSEYLLFNTPIGTSNQLKQIAEFIERHLMPVIRGEIWIDELIKERK